MSDLEEALWRLPVVVDRCGVSRNEIYRMEAAGEFPQRRLIGERSVAWLASEVVAWMRSRTAAGTKNVTPNPKAEKSRSNSNTMAA
jgi:prophage regulatory protein